MELKVWVEGIQRIVCGVTDTTTCQDVVFALAHATGKTGRFTLIERWRNNERPLAPQETPLKILMKWGEYSSDVQFVLQRSEQKHPQSQQQIQRQQEKAAQLGVQSPQNGHHIRQSSLPNPNNLNATVNTRSNPASPVTSPTQELYNKKQNMSTPAFNRDTETRKSLINSPSTEQNSNTITTKQVSQRAFNLISTQKFPGSPVFVTNSAGSSPANLTPDYTTKPSRTIEITAADVRNSLDRKINGTSQYPRGHNLSNENLLEIYSKSSPNTSNYVNISNNNNSPTVSSNGALVPPPYRDPPPPRNSPLINANNITTTKSPPTANEINGRRIDFKEQLGNNINDVTDIQQLNNTQYRDLVQLIQFQRDKINFQQSDLTKFDAEIVYLENKSRDQQHQLEAIKQEISKTDVLYRQSNEQLQTLVYVEEENQLVRQQEKTLKSEITLLRSKLANCETELLQCKNKIRLLMDEIDLEQRTIAREFDNRQQVERHLMNEVDRIQGEIEIASKTSEMANRATDDLRKDVNVIETAIAEKKKQLEQLVNQMKEVNLQSLAVAAPAEEVKNLIECK